MGVAVCIMSLSLLITISMKDPASIEKAEFQILSNLYSSRDQSGSDELEP